MKRIQAGSLLLVAGILVACEDGPDQIFTPFEGNPTEQNGMPTEDTPWVQDGEKGFELGGGDSIGRARFCDEAEHAKLVEEMVVKPIIPDVSVGGVPMWGPNNSPLPADSLIGSPADGKFCNPDGLYLDAFTWGPTQELIVFFDQETRLVDGIIAYLQYQGKMEAEYTAPGGSKVKVEVSPRNRLKIGDTEFDRYASRTDAVNRPDSWLNPVNVTNLYKAVRETFFGRTMPYPADFDCVAAKICDLIYTTSNESNPQDTFIVIQDSGIQIRFAPDGTAQFVYLQPVRSAPFEQSASIRFGQTNSSTMAFAFESIFKPTCKLDLDSGLNFGDFKRLCIENADTLNKVNYNVDTSRDAVQVEFNGMDLGFLRNSSQTGPMKDGERPRDEDLLYSISFTRSLAAPVDEFRPRTLGELYKTKLEARLRAAIDPNGGIPVQNHPFYSFNVRVPFFTNPPQTIGELQSGNGDSWVPTVLAAVRRAYEQLTPAQKAALDPRVVDDVFLVEPFVDAVLDAFTHGEANRTGAFKAFRTTDDKRWSIGFAHFKRGNKAFRLHVQYSLNFGAVTAVFLEQGWSELDQVLNTAHNSPNYYDVSSILPTAGSPFAVGRAGVNVLGFDRKLGTLEVELANGQTPLRLHVAGEPIADNSGFMRQIRGERFEFIRAHEVKLYGKETILLAYVLEDGSIGRVNLGTFKGTAELCPGLSVRYGDDVREAVTSWQKTVPANTFRDCELVFNYSENRNVLNSITSIANRTSVTVVAERAVTVSMWK